MKRVFTTDQRGVGHFGLVIAVAVVLALASIGYFVYKNKDNNSNTALRNTKCDYDDKDLCKFFTSFKIHQQVTTVITHESDGRKNITTIQRDGDTKTHVKTEASFTHEIITIGSITYTKAGDTWWKQTTQNKTVQGFEKDAKPDIKEPKGSLADTVSFKKLGKEPCGKLTCFKYQQFDKTAAAGTYFLWLDDNEYQLRRTHSEGQGFKEDSVYSYEKIDIREPSPVKELGANQYIVPGQTEPTTLPATGDLPLYE